MTPETVAQHVAAAFDCTIAALAGGYRNAARSVYIYQLVQYLPHERRRGRGSGRKRGNIKPVARLLGMWPAAVRYHLRSVEDMRDDPAFDTKVSAIEVALDAAAASR